MLTDDLFPIHNMVDNERKINTFVQELHSLICNSTLLHKEAFVRYCVPSSTFLEGLIQSSFEEDFRKRCFEHLPKPDNFSAVSKAGMLNFTPPISGKELMSGTASVIPAEIRYLSEKLHNGYFAFEVLTERDWNSAICRICGVCPLLETGDGNAKNSTPISDEMVLDVLLSKQFTYYACT